MPSRRISVAPADMLRAGFEAVRDEAGVAGAFDPAAEAEAAAAAPRGTRAAGRVELPFVTIDPPGSMDLDQALHIERRGDGHRVSYAIADVGAFVDPGGAIDAAAHTRGVTVYAPDEKTPLHPTVLSEGAASLLPGMWRPALVWTLDLDGAGELTGTDVRRAQVRSSARHTYDDVPATLEPQLREVGERRLAIEQARGGVRLAVPEQEVVKDGSSWSVTYRAPLPSEEWNAQISLLTGIAAAALMLRGGTGILRTQPPPDERALQRLRLQARALGVTWSPSESYPQFIAGLDPARAAHAALLQEAAGAGHGAGYTAFDGDPPADPLHFAIAAPYAHATAPLRRLQDRYVAECCLAACAGEPAAGWVRAALPELPAAMAAGDRRARKVERGIVDLVEAVLLQGREGERFSAVVIDDDVVQLREPAVRGRLQDGGAALGEEISVVLRTADPVTRSVGFTRA